MPPSRELKRTARRVGLAAAALWWGYAFFSTGFFTNLSGVGLVIYLVGLPICYALAWLLVLGLGWLFAQTRA